MRAINSKPISYRKWRVLDYFAWLSVIALFFGITQLLKVIQAFDLGRLPVLTTITSFGLLGLYSLPFLLLAAAVLTLIDNMLWKRSWHIVLVPRIGVVAIFLLLWLSFIRRVVASWGNTTLLIPFIVLLPGMILLIAVGMFLARKRLVSWIEDVTENVRPLSLGVSGIYVLSALYLFVIEPASYPTKTLPITSNQTQKPYVFVIILDALSIHDMSLYGYHLKTTPKLDQLAQNWTVYENAQSTGTGTLASMPTLLLGRYPYSNQWSQYANRGTDWLNLSEVAKQIGYTTVHVEGGGWPAGLFKLHHSFDYILRTLENTYMSDELPAWIAPWDYRLTQWLIPKSVPILSFILPENTAVRSANAQVSLDEPLYGYAEEFLRDQKARGNEQPIYAYMHMTRPHWYYVANEFTGALVPFDPAYNNNALFDRYWGKPYPPEEQTRIDDMRLHYDENVMKADAEVGEFIETLKQLGIYDQSLIIVTADHGTSFTNGYYGYYTKQMLAAEHQIPLLMKEPGQTEGRRVKSLVSNLDIVPTVLASMGVTYSENLVDGEPLETAENDAKRALYVRLPSMPDSDPKVISVLCGNMKFVTRASGEALYNLASDPNEQTNLLGTASVAQIELDMRNALQSYEDRMKAVDAGQSVNAIPLVRHIETCQ